MSDLKTDLDALRLDHRDEGPGGRGKWVLLAVLVLALTGGAAWWTMGRETTLEVVTAPVVERRAGESAAVLNATGYVTARRKATVSSKVTGKISEVMLEEGMSVRRGQVLARLDDASARAAFNLAAAQAESARRSVAETDVRLAEARQTLGRRAALLKEGVITQADVDAAKAEVDSLAARTAVAREQVEVATRQVAVYSTALEDLVIRAPFDGVAISKDAQPGEMVSPVSGGGGFTRTGITTLVDMTSLEIEVDVNESYIGRVKPGQRVTATLDAYPEWLIPAHVITSIPAADRQKATVLVRIGFDKLDARLIPDMGVKVAFHDEKEAASPAPDARPRMLMPAAAARGTGDTRDVFVVRDGRVERRAVRVGAVEGTQIVVLSGLTAGEQVVVNPPADLTEGKQVVIKTEGGA
ncbi:MAG: efflux RND transporter periplasmic adaptor subunit [Acidobacteriota bacterium]|nr:efflux RND transporter periplasmic adaptor subunit [Acidobacteriota bacterium]